MMSAVAEQNTLALREDRQAPAVADQAASLMDVISRAASDPATDVDKLERLMSMYERITANNAKASYAAAFSEMQTELPAIPERGKAHGNITYALWEDINDLIKPVLAKHGFGISFRTGRQGDRLTVTGVLTHRDGHSEETTMELPTDKSGSKNDVQAVGSSTSYGKRYVTQALLNLTSRGEDDDGRAAGLGPSISEDQIGDLQALIDDVGADKALFLKYMGVRSLAEIPASRFRNAVEKLNAKRGRR